MRQPQQGLCNFASEGGGACVLRADYMHAVHIMLACILS
jgi:hypothetical protein